MNPNHEHHGHEMDMSGEPLGGSASITGMMRMFLHFGLGDLLLFKGLVIDNQTKLCIACFLLFLGAVLLEALSFVGSLSCRCQLKPFGSRKLADHEHHERDEADRAYCCYGPEASQSGAFLHCEYSSLLRRQSKWHQLFLAILYAFRTALSLTLMLAAMTYNVCLIFAILLGESHFLSTELMICSQCQKET